MRFYRIKLFAFILIVGTLAISFSSCKQDKKVIKQTEVFFKKEGELTLYKITSDSTLIEFDIEFADTEYDRQTGLMYRNSMKDNQGMLFVFEDERKRSFYMKNTKIALDLIYINDNKKIVSFQKNAKPFNETSLPSNAPAKYVLEINAGLTDTWNLNIGDSLSFN
ncbi:DUF192 domain-containing protein [Hyunsoonleella aestuarii]|uniref:DUF192 domain-containing protein n=1 Tax=Hyunsoonleella aestuarii TaxID=912802 RepID=A0ABP8ECC1_9FLAO|nr:DUF192 domain-containing protein [Hyunsoonleella aestuarii]